MWSIAIFIATYLWVFEDARCSGTGDFACRLNANQGALTFYGLAVAVVAVWLTLITRLLDAHAQATASRAAFRVAFAEFIRETNHNLIHVAAAFDAQKKLRHLPQFSRVAASRMLDPEFAADLPRPLKLSLDGVYRNGERLRQVEWVDGYRDAPPQALRDFTRSSLMALLDAVRERPDACGDWMESRYARDFKRLADVHVHTHFYSSTAVRAAAHLRAVEGQVLCWWSDGEIEGVRVTEEGQRYKDVYADGG